VPGDGAVDLSPGERPRRADDAVRHRHRAPAEDAALVAPQAHPEVGPATVHRSGDARSRRSREGTAGGSIAAVMKRAPGWHWSEAEPWTGEEESTA